MKKILTLALALTMLLALAACGSSSAASTATPAPSDAPASEAPATPSPTPVPTDPAHAEAAEESDLAYIKEKGTLVIGITDFAPMDYKKGDEWVGFDADMAKYFAKTLGVTPEFIEINWDNKAMELQTRAIDCVWNGMTLTTEVKELMDCGDAYCNNGQVVVLSKELAPKYADADSIRTLRFAVENGSAGAEVLDQMGLSYVAMDTQAKALMEVASGASDACVIDLLMAGAMIGPGTSYPDLTYTVQLNSEEYGVGFRKGSDLPQQFNAFWKEACEDGTVMDTASRYGVQESVIEK